MVVGVRLTHGALISGALASQLDRVTGRLVPPASFSSFGEGGGGVGRPGREVGWLNTLLGPEETGQARNRVASKV